jgi:hypothetical protein
MSGDYDPNREARLRAIAQERLEREERLRSEALRRLALKEQQQNERALHLRSLAHQRVLLEEVHQRYGAFLRQLLDDEWFFTLMERTGLSYTEKSFRSNDDGTTTIVTATSAPSLLGAAVVASGLRLTFSSVPGQSLDTWMRAVPALREAFGMSSMQVAQERVGEVTVHIMS